MGFADLLSRTWQGSFSEQKMGFADLLSRGFNTLDHATADLTSFPKAPIVARRARKRRILH